LQTIDEDIEMTVLDVLEARAKKVKEVIECSCVGFISKPLISIPIDDETLEDDECWTKIFYGLLALIFTIMTGFGHIQYCVYKKRIGSEKN
jgi:hypothetical protein